MAAGAVQAAPAHLAEAVTVAVVSQVAPAWAMAQEVLRLMAWAKAKTAAVYVAALLIIAASVTLVVDITVVRRGRASSAVLPPSASLTMPAAGAGLKGLVRMPDGRPLADAEVLLAVRNTVIDVYEQRRSTSPSVLTGADGSFSFPPDVARDFSDLVIRSPQGFAHYTRAELPADGRLLVRPWARIEGTLRGGTTPLAGEPVGLGRVRTITAFQSAGEPGFADAWATYGVRVVYSSAAKTDASGRFAFDLVAPGEASVFRELAIPLDNGPARVRSHFTYVDVAPGQTVQADVGGTGRPVTGVLKPPASDGSLVYLGHLNVPEPVMPLPANWTSMTEGERHRYTQEWDRTPEGKALKQKRAGFYVGLAPDGSFRIEDVPPGQYRLQFRRTLDSGGQFLEVLAKAESTVTVPPIAGGRSDEPMDVGTIQAVPTPRLQVGDAAPPLQAVTFDGRTVSLGNFSGRYVLLHFWNAGLWPWIIERTAHLVGVYDRFRDDDRVTMLGINLDDDLDRAGDYAVERRMGWTLGYVKDWHVTLAPEYLNSQLTYVVNPQGKVVAKVVTKQGPYLAMDRTLRPRCWVRSGVRITAEFWPDSQTAPQRPGSSVPPIADGDAGKDAVFSFVYGRSPGQSRDLGMLNDGHGGSDDPSSLVKIGPESLEGRIRVDLARTIDVAQINTYSSHAQGGPHAQLYKVYASDGLSAGFNAAPGHGIDPVTCGWTHIATVDTRALLDDADRRSTAAGQLGASIRGIDGSLGKYRHLLFVIFATATAEGASHTPWSEIDIVERQ